MLNQNAAVILGSIEGAQTIVEDMKTVLRHLMGAQTVIALYQADGRPELHTFAFQALAETLAAPALLAAQLHLAPGPATVTLIEVPDGATVIVPLRDTAGDKR